MRLVGCTVISPKLGSVDEFRASHCRPHSPAFLVEVSSSSCPLLVHLCLVVRAQASRSAFALMVIGCRASTDRASLWRASTCQVVGSKAVDCWWAAPRPFAPSTTYKAVQIRKGQWLFSTLPPALTVSVRHVPTILLGLWFSSIACMLPGSYGNVDSSRWCGGSPTPWEEHGEEHAFRSCHRMGGQLVVWIPTSEEICLLFVPSQRLGRG